MKKNIWIWNHYATDMCKNKGGRHYWFSENLIKKGYSPTIFCANTYHNKEDYIDTRDKKYAIDVVNDIPFVFVKTIPALGNGINRVKNMVLFYINMFSVTKTYAKQNGKPDVIIASSVHPLTMVAGIQIAKKLKVPCICEIRDLWPEAIFAFDKAKEKSLLGKILTMGEHWIYKKADALIFTKEGDTDYIKEKKWDTAQGGNIDLEKCYYINNGVDIEGFIESIANNKIEDSDLESDKFNVIYTGAIRPVNDVGNLLDTAKLLKHDSNIQFLIYGDGNQKEILEKRIEDEKLTNVKMKGYINKKYIPYILSRSSVNILNYSQSQYNWTRGNSSNKLFEYMASGKPIISTVKMGYCILEKYNCGISLSKNTAEELAYTIVHIKNMEQQEYNLIGENAIKATEEFDFKNLTSKLIFIIEKV